MSKEDHKERIRHLLTRIRNGADNIERGLVFDTIGTDGAMALATAATELAYYAARHDAEKEECEVPPPGWRCTREQGHEGPCAAVRAPEGEP